MMSNNKDPARLIAERVARRLASESHGGGLAPSEPRSIGNGSAENRRARIINFVSPTPPTRTEPSISSPLEPSAENVGSSRAGFNPQVAQSPWLAPFARATVQENPPSVIHDSQAADHPSQERFGVEEAAVSELVEFFENEKQCSVDPSGKPCDHCAMCSSRGF